MARVECSNAHSGYLTSILSDDEQQFILNITKNERFWIGLSLVGDSWSWDDGSMFNYANWDPAFLEKRFYSELVAVYADKTWKVVDSGSADIGFVCKAKASPAKSQLKSTTTGGKVSLPAIFLKLQRKHRLAILLSILGVMLLGICVFAICLRRSSEAYRTQPGFVRVVAPRDTQSAAYYSVVEHADNQFYQAGNFSAFRNDNAPGFHSIRSSDYSELIDTAGISTAKMSLPGFKNQSFNDNAGSSVAENVAKTVKMRNQLNQASPYLSSNFMQ